MNLLNLGGYNLRELSRINILLGKNGCGKSRVLKLVEQSMPQQPDAGKIRYLSPERGGFLQYEASVDQAINANVSWLPNSRRNNQAAQFRQQSAVQFRELELRFLRELERIPALRANEQVNFDAQVGQINVLLDRVYLSRADRAFQINDKRTRVRVPPEDISSGESELISLGIECLVFERECVADRTNLLLIDEPDVHLHPDLQSRFAKFLIDVVERSEAKVILATHSTALLGALSDHQDCRLAFMRYGDTDLTFTETTEARRRLIPVFGAHPLSEVYNRSPILLLEGEDDERVWQQAIRSAAGRIKLYPCAVDGVPALAAFEREVAAILGAVYDEGIGYSLRDRDGVPGDIEDLGPVRRMRLSCRTAENLLLTDEVLAFLGLTWTDLERRIHTWLDINGAHSHWAAMSAFRDSGYDRANADVKDIRVDLLGLLETNKPWEIIVGQAIAAQRDYPQESPTSLTAFLGPLVCERLLGLQAPQHGA